MMTPYRSVRRRPLKPAPAFALFLALSAAVVLPAGVTRAQESDLPGEPREVERWGDLVSVFSGDVHVPANVRQRGTVVCVGGTAVIEGRVTQDVVVIFGDLELTGSVDGQVTGVLSSMELRGATVSRELVSVLGDLELEDSTVSRELVSVLGKLDRDELTRAAGQIVNIGFGRWAPSIWAVLFWVRLFHKFMVFVLLLVLVLLVPERIQLMGEEAAVRYAPAFFVGLLGYVGLWVLLGLLSFTVVGIPVALFAFYVLKWMGIAAIFYAVGRRLGRGVGFSPSVLGSVLLVFAIYVVFLLAPMALGWIGLVIVGVLQLVFLLLVALPAVGLVILTRCGGRRLAGGEPGPAPAVPRDAAPSAPAPDGTA
jgi:hypothetical protein